MTVLRISGLRLSFGAVPALDGVDVLPIESLEISYPLRVERYELRAGSGGTGLHAGGDGLVRSIRVIDHDARVSFSADRRRHAPYGLHGGGDETPGRHFTQTPGGVVHEHRSKTSLSVQRGELIVVESPGGGAWGANAQDPAP